MNLPLIWIIPALPLAAVLLNLLFGDRLGKQGTFWLACGSVGLAFAFAVRAVFTLAGMPRVATARGCSPAACSLLDRPWPDCSRPECVSPAFPARYCLLSGCLRRDGSEPAPG